MKTVDKKKNPGLAKLPTKVRNKMGYKKKGGKLKKMMGGGAMGKTMMKPDMMKKGGKTKKMMGGGTMGRTMMKPNMMYKKGGKGKK
tara:strand:- start:362 stop:619 length:258 start_codon:yes stop_codon:yes gene_type:complete